MSYNQNKTTAPIRGLVASGSDLMKHMYDVKIWFPDFTTGGGALTPFNSYPITVRAKGFKPPEFSVKTYKISYHGVSIDRPGAALEGDRKVTMTFREDAAFELRQRFHQWQSVVGDPVTGGVSNGTYFYGKISVGTIAGTYFAPSVNWPTGVGKDQGTNGNVENGNEGDIEDTLGHLTNRNKGNPIADWTFYNVWVGKVTQPDFQTEAGDANDIEVEFYFMDIDYPIFGGNTIFSDGSDKSAGTDWGPNTWANNRLADLEGQTSTE